MRGQPKKNITFVKLKDKEFGLARRKSYAKEILEKSPIFPKPLEYEDIDEAFKSFVEEEIPMVADGKKIPTFSLYSSQRFSEYSQTWEHTDEDGNLLMNFKTVNRDNNPSSGDNQGGLWNIPGERRYTLLTRTIMEDSGKEVYEIYSMKQPYAVDLSYRVNFVTNIYESINRFNERINELFKARQFYIRPNGHYIPMVIDEINDETQYGVADRKFYVQSIIIKVMAYIIHESDFKVERKPKSVTAFMEGDTNRPKPQIDIDEYENPDRFANKTLDVTISFEEWHDKVEFDIDCDVVVEDVEMRNIRQMRLFVNDTPIYSDKGFSVKDGDNIKIKIRTFDPTEKSSIIFHGYDPNYTYEVGKIHENVFDEPLKHENIVID